LVHGSSTSGICTLPLTDISIGSDVSDTVSSIESTFSASKGSAKHNPPSFPRYRRMAGRFGNERLDFPALLPRAMAFAQGEVGFRAPQSLGCDSLWVNGPK
jgi:hypothetical protein